MDSRSPNRRGGRIFLFALTFSREHPDSFVTRDHFSGEIKRPGQEADTLVPESVKLPCMYPSVSLPRNLLFECYCLSTEFAGMVEVWNLPLVCYY